MTWDEVLCNVNVAGYKHCKYKLLCITWHSMGQILVAVKVRLDFRPPPENKC